MTIAALDPATLVTRLEAWIGQFDSAIVAYSGGVDSAVVMAAAHKALGPKALACIGVSPSYPQRERDAAVALAQSLGARLQLVETQEHLDPRYNANASDRCYFCKSELYNQLATIAKQESAAVMLDGNNADDLLEDRPGRMAARERSVQSPLAELGMTKADVRAAARAYGLSVADKPAMACLASRVPTGSAIMPGLLLRIEKAEDVLAKLGFRQFRARHHETLVRIELEPADIPRALEKRLEIVAGLRAFGYKHITLDLAGFRAPATDPAIGVQP